MLNFEKVLELPQGITKEAHLGNEPKNELYEYYMRTNYAQDVHTLVDYANYNNLEWSAAAASLTSQKVRRIGIKTFPQVGAIGFFTLLNEERSKILAPVHTKVRKYTAPSLTVQETDTTLIFTISPPIDYDIDKDEEDTSGWTSGNIIEDFTDGTTGTVNISLEYVCYRVILRLGDFAHEYITYDQILEVPKPATTGTYDIYCVGYIHEGEAVSEDSNHVYLDITGTQDTWPGPMEGSDLFITDVEVTDENKVHIRRSDGFQKDSDNLIPMPTAATFLDSGKLMLTFNNGQTLVSDNAPSGSGGDGGGTSQFAVYASAIIHGDSGVVTSASCEISSGDDSSTLLAFVTTREETTFSDGWELVHKFEPAYYGTDTTRQTMYVLKKSGNANTFMDKITVRVATASRIYIAMLCLRGVNSITADSSTLNLPSTDVNSINVTKFKNKSIYAIQAVSVSTPTLSITPNDRCLLIPCGYRLWLVVDLSDTFEHTINLSSTVSGLQANVIGIE